MYTAIESSFMKTPKCLKLLLGALLLSGCVAARQSAGPTAQTQTQTRETQAAITPSQALTLLKDGNERFVSGQMLHRDLRQEVLQTSSGQYPFAVVVSCLDSRVPAELIFDQGLGDIFSARVAGNVVNEDILGSLEFATKVSGSKLIVVIGHASCGAIKGACDDVQLGHLTALLARIKPSVDSVQTGAGETRSSKNSSFVQRVAEANVRYTLKTIRMQSPILNEMIEKGQIGLVGGNYDLGTGKVTFFSE
jgi:carbonic anhydrase